MKQPSTQFLLAVLLTTWSAGPAAAHDDGPRAWDGRRHVVHEWGTFTAVQGADGVTVGGLLHDPFGLPPFVYDLRHHRGLTGLRVKMETPVVYFYAPGEWRLRVDVDFPRGLISQWYPAASRANLGGAATAPGFDLDGALAGARVRDPEAERARGYVRWGMRGELTVLAPGAPEDLLPEVEPHDPWRFSRQVGANALRVTNQRYAETDEGRPIPGAEARQEYERFLFYRGLADFDLPLRARVASEAFRDGRCTVELSLENAGADGPLTHVVLLVVQAGSAGFVVLPDVAGAQPMGTHELTLAPAAGVADELVGVVANGLAATGLYTDEAFAMARTWRDSWFLEEGLRVLYVLPPAQIERELPLAVKPYAERRRVDGEVVSVPTGPVPDEVVRTFVGRHDLVSPERERALLDTVAGCLSTDPTSRDRASEQVRSWGRYAEPLLRRAEALGAPHLALAAARALTEPTHGRTEPE